MTKSLRQTEAFYNSMKTYNINYITEKRTPTAINDKIDRINNSTTLPTPNPGTKAKVRNI